MPAIEVGVKVGRSKKLRDLSKELRAAGNGDLRKELLKDVRKAADPVVKDFRRAVVTRVAG